MFMDFIVQYFRRGNLGSLSIARLRIMLIIKYFVRNVNVRCKQGITEFPSGVRRVRHCKNVARGLVPVSLSFIPRGLFANSIEETSLAYKYRRGGGLELCPLVR